MSGYLCGRFADKESCATARGQDLVGAITGSADHLNGYTRASLPQPYLIMSLALQPRSEYGQRSVSILAALLTDMR